uniref:Uncharacterized protein n=1 Tax=Meloidogyne javanica TaxID=6303 RepID=A0A915LHV5_MELJA
MDFRCPLGTQRLCNMKVDFGAETREEGAVEILSTAYTIIKFGVTGLAATACTIGATPAGGAICGAAVYAEIENSTIHRQAKLP